MRRTWILR